MSRTLNEIYQSIFQMLVKWIDGWFFWWGIISWTSFFSSKAIWRLY